MISMARVVQGDEQKDMWGVKLKQSNLGEGEPNDAEHCWEQAGIVQPGSFLLWLAPFMGDLS